MELVTGYRGINHVTAEQLADLQAGIIGYDACILNIGEKLKADVITSNKIRIFDGVFVFHGKEAIIEAGDYQDITIENGTIGLYRNDIIAVEYKKDEGTGVENTTLKVIKGATASTAKDPVTSTNDVRAGAFESEIALYRVKLNGLAIEKVEVMCTICDNISSLKSYFANSLTELNRKLAVTNVTSSFTVDPAILGFTAYKLGNQIFLEGLITNANVAKPDVSIIANNYRPIMRQSTYLFNYGGWGLYDHQAFIPCVCGTDGSIVIGNSSAKFSYTNIKLSYFI